MTAINEKGTNYRHHRAGWAYLAEFLRKKGYEVHGLKRRTSLFNTDRIDHLHQDPYEMIVRYFSPRKVGVHANKLVQQHFWY